MKVEEIERLLAEFYEGNTNEQEEELLKEAFRTEEVPEHLQKDKKLFLSFFPGEVVDNVPAGSSRSPMKSCSPCWRWPEGESNPL